jgi:hypothetical protein
MWKSGLWLRNSFSENICFEFPVLILAVWCIQVLGLSGGRRRRMAEMVKPVLDQLTNYIIVDIGECQSLSSVVSDRAKQIREWQSSSSVVSGRA